MICLLKTIKLIIVPLAPFVPLYTRQLLLELVIVMDRLAAFVTSAALLTDIFNLSPDFHLQVTKYQVLATGKAFGNITPLKSPEPVLYITNLTLFCPESRNTLNELATVTPLLNSSPCCSSN